MDSPSRFHTCMLGYVSLGYLWYYIVYTYQCENEHPSFCSVKARSPCCVCLECRHRSFNTEAQVRINMSLPYEHIPTVILLVFGRCLMFVGSFGDPGTQRSSNPTRIYTELCTQICVSPNPQCNIHPFDIRIQMPTQHTKMVTSEILRGRSWCSGCLFANWSTWHVCTSGFVAIYKLYVYGFTRLNAIRKSLHNIGSDKGGHKSTLYYITNQPNMECKRQSFPFSFHFYDGICNSQGNCTIFIMEKARWK